MTSSYVNNLRLNEQGTGDNSGSWGTVTNLNLELIGQAFGFGTRAIANAPADNITIADGASDADRSMYLKLTGGGQACTVTFLPNDVSKVWLLENATSATLTFTQGSGANVAVLAGQVKMIATDGGGTDAIVYDLLTDVNLAGTTVTDIVTANQATVDDIGLNGKVITMTGSAGDTATLTVAANGALAIATTDAAAAAANISITADGTFTAVGTTITLDSAGDIVLDADGAEVFIADGGTTIGKLANDGATNFTIASIVQDRDILFQGSDGGSVITALSLDMSAGGNALFSGTVTRDLTRGSLDVGNSSGVSAPLAAGGADTVLTSNGTDLSWVAAASGFMGNVVTISNSGVTTLSAAQSGSLVNVTNAAAIIKLPVSAAGLFYGIRNSTTAETPIRGNGNGVFVNSTIAPVKVLETDGFVLLVGIDSTHWAADYDVQSSSTLVRYTNTTGNNNYSVTHTTSALTTGMAIFIFGGLPKMGYGSTSGNSGGAVYFSAGAAGAGYSEKLITSSIPSSLTISGDYVNTVAAQVNNPGTAQKLTVAGTGTTMVSTPPQGAFAYTINPRNMNATAGSITGGTFNANGGQGRASPGTAYNNADLRMSGGGGMGSPAGVGGRAYNGNSNAGTNYITGTNTVWASNQASGQQKFSHAGGSGGNDGTATAGGAGDTKDSNAVAWTNYLGKEFFCPAGGASVRPTAQGYASNTYFGSDNPNGSNGPSGSNFGNTPSDLILMQGPGNRPLFTYTTGARGGNNFGNLGATPAQVVIIDLKG